MSLRRVAALDVWEITCIQNALCQDCSKLGHNIIVLIIDHFGIELSELADLNGRKRKRNYKTDIKKHESNILSLWEACWISA